MKTWYIPHPFRKRIKRATRKHRGAVDRIRQSWSERAFNTAMRAMHARRRALIAWMCWCL